MAKSLMDVVVHLKTRQAMTNPASLEASMIPGLPTASAQAQQIAKHTVAATTPEFSLSEFTQASNVEPRVMIEDSLKLLPNIDKWLMTMTNLYSAYYLQAVALSADVGGVSVISRLDKFNPNRNPTNTIIGALVSKENYLDHGYVLPSYKKSDINYSALPFTSKAVESIVASLEDPRLVDAVNALNKVKKEGEQEDSNTKITQGKSVSEKDKHTQKQIDTLVSSSMKQIADIDNLAVGRLLEVTLMINGQRINVPVSVRMRPMSVPKIVLRELVAMGDIRNSWKERWHRMRSGELSLVSDWIFQMDRLKEKRKLITLDKQGLYKEMIERRKNNRASAALSGNVSIGSAASFIVISKETAKEVELRTAMPIENPEFRKRIFAENSAMMIMVVDREWETIDCYTRGVSGVANWTFKQFEGLSKGNGPDITEIMKAYMVGQNPRF